jgi:hypothetical protein
MSRFCVISILKIDFFLYNNSIKKIAMSKLTPWEELLIAAGVPINQEPEDPYGALFYAGCRNTSQELEETLLSGVIIKPKPEAPLRRTSLLPLNPVHPLFYDDEQYMSLGAKAEAYRAMYAASPKYMNRGLTLEEEKRYYMSFRTNIDPTAIRFLIAYYKACGLDTLEERLARFQQIYNYRG